MGRRHLVADGHTPSKPEGSRSGSPPGLRYREEELQILFDTIHDLTSTLSIREVIRRLLERVLVHLDSEIASILMVGPDRRLRIAHARGLPEEVVATTCLGPGDGISGYVAETGEAVLIEDIERDPRFRRRNHERYYTRSAISAPLRIHGAAVGVINVNNKRSRQVYAKGDLRLIQAIAGHAAVALFNARRYEETLERAERDALTGLANHGHFWATLGVEFERASRYGRSLSLAMIDVDHFKAFNDRYGHLAGDEALAGVGRVLSEGSRVHDFAARYGGEEFAVLLPETDNGGGSAVAEKFRQAVEAGQFAPAAPGEVTVSIGVSTFPDDGSSAAELVAAADLRLYAAKEQGRNQVRAAS
jgi:diguanylate cyclase (GGDEF)-like protein